VVANLPYQITSQVLRTLLELEHPPESITVMVQKEVAERICAKPARKASPRAKGNMSLLAVSVQYYGVPKMVAKVTKGNFWPEPKVDSAILEIRNLKSEIRDRVSDRFFDVVKAGFSNKRKQAWRNISVGLGIDGEVVKQVLDEVVGNEKVRAQELSVEEWVMVVEKLSTQQT
jgi:16S rRNA (adenine1518-N6/adenine1519-N6)-dimethyltransferase